MRGLAASHPFGIQGIPTFEGLPQEIDQPRCALLCHASPMRMGVTGAEGFLGWHLRSLVFAKYGVECLPITREHLHDEERLVSALSEVDVVVHLAGMNRGIEHEVVESNLMLADKLSVALRQVTTQLGIVNANSIHSHGDTAFGRSKAEASAILRTGCVEAGHTYSDVVLPNVFGEHGRPFYNSFVATFCHQLANGEEPRIDVDREFTLVHAQEAVAELLAAAESRACGVVEVAGPLRSVSEVLARLREISDLYSDGQLPNLANSFTRDLFNTYRSFTFPHKWPFMPVRHMDDRGDLVEAVRADGGETQVFFSTTQPGKTRGNHFHLRKVERFLVLRGEAVIRLRRMFTNEVVEFRVGGSQPAVLDMPTLWTHSITNVGKGELLTLFYADDKYDPDDPDTYWVDV